jgi:hypothetical protein
VSAPARPLFDPAEFRIGAGIAHLCAGGETPFLRRHDAALRRYAVDKSNGEAGRHAQEAEVERARARRRHVERRHRGDRLRLLGRWWTRGRG